jgi:DNA-binding NtrC family response regulator
VTARATIEAERLAIQRSLRDFNGDVGRAAERLKIGSEVLLAKMRELGFSTSS